MATQTFENLGPIYTTASKYETMKTAGTLEVGREYKIIDWEAQEKISDLDTIRSGAALGATAIQEHQSLADYRKSADQDVIDATKQDKLIAGTNITIDEDGKTINAPNNAYNSIKQIADYLFEVEYSTENIDYTYANDYFKALPPTNENGAACTGIYKDGKVLRQLDWYYNNNVEFIVRRPKDELKGIHASIGIASSIDKLTKEIVESGEYNRKFKMVPFIITDGINDAGLYIQSNVVPELDGGFDLNPTAATECCITMAIRYMLDHCASFDDVETFFNTVHIYNTSAVPKYNYHFLLAQGDAWEVIELTATGHMTVTEGTGTNQMPHGIMTNFRTTGLSFDENTEKVVWSSIEQYGGGVERYDIATRAFTDSRSFDLLREDLQYTKMYTGATPEWLTELCGETDETYGKLTVMDAVNNQDKFTALMEKDKYAYQHRDRYAENPDTWQTVHSAIYDLSAKSIEVCIQERFNEKFTFKLVEEPDLSNFVTLTDNQDIYGNKTFHSPVMYSTGLNATRLDDKKIVTSGAMSPAITYNLPSKAEGEYTLATEDYVTEQVSTKQDTIDDLADIRDGAALGATALQSHQDISGKLNILPNVEDPTDPGYGYPYWIPYSFATTPKTDGLDITLKTLTLDNTLRKMNFTNAFPVVSSSQAGIMTASDKSNLDTINSDYLKSADKSELENKISTETSNREASDSLLDERLKKFELPAEPEVKTINNINYLFANGVAIRIEDNSTENIAYYCTAEGVQKSITFPYQSVVHGGGLGTATKSADINSTLVIMNSGKVKNIYGGSRDYGNVGVATIIVNDGTLQEGVIGGGAAAQAEMINSVGLANITLNGGTSLMTYGGGMGLAAVGKVNLIVRGGTQRWLTAGGANGTTGSADVVVSGGTITCLQAVNRGIVQDATITISGGTITNVYGGGETSDSSVTGKCEKTILHIEKSFGGTLNKGTYGGTEDASRVSGDYITGTITESEATDCNLTLITEKQDKLVSGTNIKTINNNSLLGSGNIEVKTFQAFPSDIKTGEQGESLSDFISSIESSTGAAAGMAYLGSIYNDVLPWTGGGNAECKIEYIDTDIALVTVSSSNIEPYLWTMNTWEGVWRGSQGNLTAGTGIDISDVTPSSEYTIKTAIKVTGVEYSTLSGTQPNALKFVKLSQEAYNNLGTKDADTLYIIVD